MTEKIKKLFFTTALIAGLTGCMERNAPPAPVVNLGVHLDSPAGAIMVSQNDTLYDISQRYGLALRDIIDANNIAAPYTINAGQRLKLPPPREYTVERGDTLYRISRMFGMNMTDLARQNHLNAPYKLNAGRKLVVTHAEPAPSVQKPAYSYQPRVETPQELQTMPVAKPAKIEKVVLAPPTTTKTYNVERYEDKGFIWPVKGAVLSSYGPKDSGLHNDGLNIKAAKGTAVSAANSGQVMYVGDALKGFGNLVLLRHANGWVTAYGHLDSVSVTKGQKISQGDKLGTIGTSGRVDQPQLHFEIRRGSEALNPEKYLPKV